MDARQAASGLELLGVTGPSPHTGHKLVGNSIEKGAGGLQECFRPRELRVDGRAIRKAGLAQGRRFLLRQLDKGSIAARGSS